MWDTSKRGWSPEAKWKGWALMEVGTPHVLGKETESKARCRLIGRFDGEKLREFLFVYFYGV